jgi:hypothetical protein
MNQQAQLSPVASIKPDLLLTSPRSDDTVMCHGCGGWVRVSHPTPPGTSSHFSVCLEGAGHISPLVGVVHEDFSDWEGEKWPHRGAW